eukprot:COSAG02_NODE_2895_length_7786_cov_3.419930_6_plen_20_part_01
MACTLTHERLVSSPAAGEKR